MKTRGINLQEEESRIRCQFIVFFFSFMTRFLYMLFMIAWQLRRGYNFYLNWISILMFLVWNFLPTFFMLKTHMETYWKTLQSEQESDMMRSSYMASNYQTNDDSTANEMVFNINQSMS